MRLHSVIFNPPKNSGEFFAPVTVIKARSSPWDGSNTPETRSPTQLRPSLSAARVSWVRSKLNSVNSAPVARVKPGRVIVRSAGGMERFSALRVAVPSQENGTHRSIGPQLKPEDTYETARNFSTLLGAQRALRWGAGLLALGCALAAYVGWHPRKSTFSLFDAFYGLFIVFAAVAVFRMWRYGQAPFDPPQQSRAFWHISTPLQMARWSWIVAEWLRWA